MPLGQSQLHFEVALVLSRRGEIFHFHGVQQAVSEMSVEIGERLEWVQRRVLASGRAHRCFDIHFSLGVNRLLCPIVLVAETRRLVDLKQLCLL